MNQEQLDKLESGITKVIAYVVQNSETNIDNAIVGRIAQGVKAYQKSAENVNEGTVIEGVKEIAEFVTSLTPTKVDDGLVQASFATLDMSGITSKLSRWINEKIGRNGNGKRKAQTEGEGVE